MHNVHPASVSFSAHAIMNKEPIDELSFRLPQGVKPWHYDVYLHPDLNKGTFQGKVTILIDVLDSRSYIAVHQKDLNITSTNLKTHDRAENYEFEVLETIQMPKNEMIVVSTKDELHSGLYNLTFEFNGALQPDKIVGFYSSKYKDAQNRTRWVLYIATRMNVFFILILPFFGF